MKTFLFPLFGYIYLITFPNGKVYVGQKASPVFLDWYWGSGTLLPRAYAKHGKPNCKREIIAWCGSQESLDAAETQMIETYRSREREFGYNLAAGGHKIGGDTHPETIEKLKKVLRTEEGCAFASPNPNKRPIGRVGKFGWIGVYSAKKCGRYFARLEIYSASSKYNSKLLVSSKVSTPEEAARLYDGIVLKTFPATPAKNMNFIDGKRNPRCVKLRKMSGVQFDKRYSVMKCYRSCVELTTRYTRKKRSLGLYAYRPIASLVSDFEKIRRSLVTKTQKLSFPELLQEPHLQDWEHEDILDYLLPDWKDDKYHCDAYKIKYLGAAL